MSNISKQTPKTNLLYKSFKTINKNSKSRSFSVKSITNITLNQDFYKKSVEIFNPNLQILSYIMDFSKRRFSAKTGLSNSIPEYSDYNLEMINKHKENLDSSLSFISDFDLENDAQNELDSSFNSEKNDDSAEIIEISEKRSIFVTDKIININEDNKLNKDFCDIKKMLLGKKI